MACFLLAAVAAALAADIFLNVVKNRHQRLAVFGQAVLDPGRDLVVVDAQISFGAVNAKVEDNLDILDFVYNADKVLYKVKEKGRNNYMVIEME